MKIKKYIYMILTVIGGILLFTGCMPHIPMTIKGEELPADSVMHILLRSVEEKKQKLYIPDDINGTELEGYNRDGWVPAAYVDYVYENHTDNGTVLEVSYGDGASDDEIRAFCQKYKEVRFAVVDKKGKILYITDTLNLIPSDRFGYPKDVTYSARTGRFTIDNIVDKQICGVTLFGWWLMVSVFSWITDIILLAVVRKAIKCRDRNYFRQMRLPIILLALPSVIELIIGIVAFTVPYFGGNAELSNFLELLKVFAVLNVIFIADILFLPIAIKYNK